MTPSSREPSRRPPYWTLPVFVALMLVPAPWFPAAVGITLAIAAFIRVAPALARRRARTRADLPGTVTLGRERAAPIVGRPAASAPLGRARVGPAVALDTSQLAAHGLILGASGSGKSTTLLRLMTERVAQGLPVVALDLKGSPAFARTLADAAARAGRPFQLWTPDGPAYWNPLAHGNATELKDRLISTERFTEPHYQRAAERYLQNVLTVLHALEPEAPATLADVVALSEPRRLAAAARRVAEPLRSRVQDYVAALRDDQLSAVRGLGTRLAIITESHSGRYLAAPPGSRAAAAAATVDLRSALRGDTVVAFSLNSSSYGKLAAQIGTIVVQDLVSAAGERLERELVGGAPPALVGIDEFSALGAEHLVALFARGRAAGVSVVVATQELADLDRAARGLRDQVLGNTAVKVIHRQDVPASAQLAAQLAGTHWVSEETRQFGGAGPLREALMPRGSRREVERYLVHPNEIRSLATGAALLITKLPVADVRLVEVTPPRAAAPDSGRARGAGGPSDASGVPAAASGAPAAPETSGAPAAPDAAGALAAPDTATDSAGTRARRTRAGRPRAPQRPGSQHPPGRPPRHGPGREGPERG